MNGEVEGNHPVAEIIGRKLAGLSGVPKEEQAKMVQRCVKAAVEYCESLSEHQGQFVECSERKPDGSGHYLTVTQTGKWQSTFYMTSPGGWDSLVKIIAWYEGNPARDLGWKGTERNDIQ